MLYQGLSNWLWTLYDAIFLFLVVGIPIWLSTLQNHHYGDSVTNSEIYEPVSLTQWNQ